MHVPTGTATVQPQKAIRLNKLKDCQLVNLQGAVNGLLLFIRDSIILITILYAHIGSFIYKAQKDFISVVSLLSPFQRLKNGGS